MASEEQCIAEQGVLTLPDSTWERARQRTEVIGPLAALPIVGHDAADIAADALGLSRRQIYVLIQRARQGIGLVTDLAPRQSSAGKGTRRLSEPVERIIRELMHKRFLTRQKRSVAVLYREVTRACKAHAGTGTQHRGLFRRPLPGTRRMRQATLAGVLGFGHGLADERQASGAPPPKSGTRHEFQARVKF